VSQPARITHVRLTIAPDGGVARLRVHGEPVPDPRDLFDLPLDLAAVDLGGVVTDCSDMYFSHRHNLNLPTAPQSMADGWETRRRRGPRNDWVVVRLAEEGVVRVAEVDTRFFKGNAPASFSLDARRAAGWAPVLGSTALRPHLRHRFRVPPHEPASQIRMNIHPDGGVARLRLWGQLSRQGAEALGLRWLDTLSPARARQELRQVCASTVWCDRVADGRPYGSLAALQGEAARVWQDLGPDGWREAFAAHPRIGERAHGWSRDEQSGVSAADADLQAELVRANEEYEERFGHVFLIRAAGRSATEVLDALRGRMTNDPDTELRVAADEHRQITELRLERLVRP
jgi:OHCU decarboxylase